MKIGVVGAYCNGNLGDELFWRCWQDAFANVSPVRIVGRSETLDDVDRIVIGGGDLVDMEDYREDFWDEYLLSRPCWVYAVGACRSANEQTLKRLRAFLNRCRAVYVRDDWSAQQLLKAKIAVAGVVPDLAWTTWIPERYPRVSWYNAVGLSLRVEQPGTPAELAAIRNAASSHGLQILGLPMQANSYLASDAALHRDLGGLDPTADCTVRASACGWPRMVITTRIHVAICAMLQRTPVMLWFRRGNTSRFSLLAQQFGLPTIPSPASATEIRDAIDAALARDWTATWSRVTELRRLAFSSRTSFVTSVTKG